MLLDSTQVFDPAGTAITVTASSTNVLDMGVARDMGIGDDPLVLVVLSDGTFAAAGAATLNIALQGSPDNATWTVYAESSLLTIAWQRHVAFALNQARAKQRLP
jgi:hypothetical protein